MKLPPAWMVGFTNEVLAGTEAALRYAMYEAELDDAAMAKIGLIANHCRLEIHRRTAAAQECDLI